MAAQTEHFVFYTRDNRNVDAEKSERYLRKVSLLLGQRVSGRTDYYRYSTPEQVAVATGTYAAGVTFARLRQIHSIEPFHAHEIVHLVAGQLGNPGAFFEEGLAVALGNEGKWYGKNVDALAKPAAKAAKISTLVASFERMDAQLAYPVAGSFVASLIKVHGIAKVASFFRACSGKNLDDAFARTFGLTLEEAGTAWTRSL